MEKSIIQRLIDAGVFSHKDVEQYIDEYNKQKSTGLIAGQIEQTKTEYSVIENRVLVKFDERDLDEYGNYTTPDRVKKIKKYAFAKVNAEKITLGKNVKYIEDYALWDCNAKKIEIKGNVKRIGEYAFHLCLNLEEIELPDLLEEISKGMLDNCIKLRAIKLPKNLKYIRSYAFARCISLTSISDLPAGLQQVELSVCVHAPVENKFNDMVRNHPCTVERPCMW